MVWIEPLALETWLINVLSSGSVEIFTAVALLFLLGLAGYFRMTALTMMYLVAIFFIMFAGYVDISIYFVLASLSSLLIGYWVSKLVKG